MSCIRLHFPYPPPNRLEGRRRRRTIAEKDTLGLQRSPGSEDLLGDQPSPKGQNLADQVEGSEAGTDFLPPAHRPPPFAGIWSVCTVQELKPSMLGDRLGTRQVV